MMTQRDIAVQEATARTGPLVDTSLGAIRGRRRDGIEQYLGIRYAQAPVGDLRFRAPVAVEAWTGTYDASSLGPVAPQPPRPHGSPLPSRDFSYDEDCLVLNIYTPASDGGRRPVLVWIHGGAYVRGSGDVTDGTSFAQLGDIVVVTLNYRFGALGFMELGHLDPTLAGSQNNGIRDQGLMGSMHALEIPFVWNQDLAPWAPLVGDADPGDLANRMHRSWIAFVRDGNPSHDGIGDWPAYELDRRPDHGVRQFQQGARRPPRGNSRRLGLEAERLGEPMVQIYLATIALEPNRWFGVTQDRWATITASEWLDRIRDAGFDGIELWEAHATEADPSDLEAIFEHDLGVAVYNTYVSFDDESDAARQLAAEMIRRSGARKVKWNTGAERDDAALDAYAERLARWVAELPGVQAVCECHDGSAMDDPAAAARVLSAGDPADVVGALVHTHDSHDLLRAKFDAYGERISHVHINHLNLKSPPLADIRDEFTATVDLLTQLGFNGAWSLEFVDGTLSESGNQPEKLFAAAVADLGVLREILG